MNTKITLTVAGEDESAIYYTVDGFDVFDRTVSESVIGDLQGLLKNEKTPEDIRQLVISILVKRRGKEKVGF